MSSSVHVRRVSSLPHPKPTSEQYFGLMGETLLFQTNSERLLDAAIEAFGRYPIPSNADENPLIVRLFMHDLVSGQEHPTDQWPQPIFHTQAHLFSISVGLHNLGVVDVQRGFAYGFVTPSMADDLRYVRYTFIEAMAFSMLSRARGYVPIHAACVVKNKQAVLLQAKAGTGKSTLAYACLRRGYHLLAEDVVHIRTSKAALQLWGAPWKFHLLPDSRQLFPELGDQQALLQMNGEWKIELNVDEHFPGKAVTCADPGPVILLERGSQGITSLKYLPPNVADCTIEVLWPWDSGWKDEHEDAITRLVSNGGAYTLQMNDSPDAAVDQIDQLLERLS